MESLALLVTLLFVTVIIIGPICYGLSHFDIIPQWIIYILSVITIFVGIWWVTLVPVIMVRWIGLLPIYLGCLSISKVQNRKNEKA